MKRMKKLLSLLLTAALALCALPAPGALAAEPALRYEADFAAESLGEVIERYLADQGLADSRLLIGWQDTESGAEWFRGADVYMEGGNTYRLPLCMLYADRVDEGLLERRDKVGPYVLERAVEAVLTSASPNPADALRYGVSYDHREYRAAIAQNCGMDAETLPNAYFSANLFSPRFLVGTLRSLWDGGEKYDWLLDCLKRAQPDNAVGLYRDGLEIAHIIGRGEGFYCDTALVYAERPFLLTVMTSGVPNAERVIGEIARIAMDYAAFLAAHPGFTPIPAPEPKEGSEEEAAIPGLAPEPEATPAPVFHFEADFSAESLGEVIERYLEEKNIPERSLTVGWYDLTDGEEWYRGSDTFMEGASTYKLPLAMVYADKLAAGELSEESKIRNYTLRTALEKMLIDSNNYAGEALRDNLSRNYAEYRRMLVPHSGLDESELPERFFRLNVFSPRFLIGTLRTLWEDPDTYAPVLDLMKQARPRDYFSAYRGDYEVAHKYGSDEGYVCDSGIIYCERPFLLTVMSYSVPGAKAVTGEIARIAMDYAEYRAAQAAPAPEPSPEPAPEASPASTPAPAPEASPAPALAPAPETEAPKRPDLPLAAALAAMAAAAAATVLLRRRKKSRESDNKKASS